MDDKMVGELMQRLDALGAKLGVGAQVLWGALLKQAAIDSTVSLIIGALTAIGIWLYFTKMVPWANRVMDAGSSDDEFGAVVITGFAGLMLAIFSVAFVISLDVTIAGLVNPDYWALHEILRYTKK